MRNDLVSLVGIRPRFKVFRSEERKFDRRQGVVYLQTGDVLSGKYRILKALGKGGEGSVWLAVHLQTVQLWAVKEIGKQRNGQEFHEINMMKKLRHPSLPQILDVLEDEENCYLIMEYVRGHTLEEWLKRNGRLAPEEVLEIGCEISGVLDYLHNQTMPILHLDIKPSNIIRKKDGRLVLVDFGAARRRSGFEKEEQDRRGTDGYAAPEQYDRSKSVDGRTDIYGLGATLYHLVSGVRYSPALQKSKVNGCPDYLGEIIRKCVQTQPEARWENSRSLCRSLGRAKKKYDFQKQRYRFWIALLLMILITGTAVQELRGELRNRLKQDWDYERLLEEALCAGEDEREEYYRKAVFAAPERCEAYLQYLHQVDADAVLEKQEEEFLRSLLYTIPLGKTETYEEMLAEEPECYGAFASELGLIYWYDYEGADGRKIAAGWFAKALQASEALRQSRRQTAKQGDRTVKPESERQNSGKMDIWEIRARIYSHMGSYYEQLGKRDESGERENFAAVYWEELKQLLETGIDGYRQPITGLRFCREALWQITFLAEELQKAGIEKDELALVIKEIVQKSELLIPKENCAELGEELKQEIASGAQTAEEILEHLENIRKRNTA